MNVLTRAKRILTRLANFRADFKDGVPPTVAEPLDLIGEALIGVYENSPSSSVESVVVTDKGLRTEINGVWVKMEFSDIESVKLPLPEGLHRSEAVIVLIKKDGSSVSVPIRGGQGRFFDLYEFGRFLMRVRDDVARSSQA